MRMDSRVALESLEASLEGWRRVFACSRRSLPVDMTVRAKRGAVG